MDRLLSHPDFEQESFWDDEESHWPVLHGDDLVRAKEASIQRIRAIREGLEAMRGQLRLAIRLDNHWNKLLRKQSPH